MSEDKHLMTTYNRLPVQFVRGEGNWLIDNNGNRYFDALCGISVTSLGHNHPTFVNAVQDQVATLTHTSNLFEIGLQEELAKTLCHASGMDKAFFCNSGTEANEAAIKLARLHYNNTVQDSAPPAIITFEGGFHGRTLGAIAATANRKIKAGFEPQLEQFIHLPLNDETALQKTFKEYKNIAAVLIEPVQGEGGINIASPEFLTCIQQLCQAHNALFMLDEVQSGNARCGKYFAFQLHENTEHELNPDVVTTAKGLGNGFPIGACLAQGKAANVMSPGKHGTTFGGNPLACRASLAVLDVIQNEQLADNAGKMGRYLADRFQENLRDEPLFSCIRQQGLMLGIELTISCSELVKKGLENGIVINVTADKVIRLLPALNITVVDADLIVDKVTSLIKSFK